MKFLVVLLWCSLAMADFSMEMPDESRPVYRELIVGEVQPDGSVKEVSKEVLAPQNVSTSDDETPPAKPSLSYDKVRVGVENRVDLNARVYPFSAVARLTFSSDDGNFSCTGWRASKRIMMTNGHCVYDRGRKKFHTTNRADFGYRNGAFVQRENPVLLVVSKWYQDGVNGVDWGMYVLRSNVPNATGWFGSKNYNTSWDDKNYWRVSGYGSNMTGHPFNTQFQTANNAFCKVDKTIFSGRALFNDCDSGQGNSGSPIFGYWEVPYAVGVIYGEWGPRDANRMLSCSPLNVGTCGNVATRQSVFVGTLIEYIGKYP